MSSLPPVLYCIKEASPQAISLYNGLIERGEGQWGRGYAG